MGHDRRNGRPTPQSVTGVSKANHTVNLSEDLQKRIDRAMLEEGYTVWADFCRAALSEKCLREELKIRQRSTGGE